MIEVSQELSTPLGSIVVNGGYESRFERVFAHFLGNFLTRGEIGAVSQLPWRVIPSSIFTEGSRI